MSWISDNIPPEISDYLFNLKLVLPNRSAVQRDVRPDLEIDFEDLETQLQETPEMICFWDMLYAEQKCTVAAIERTILTKKAQVGETVTKDSLANGRDLRRKDIEDIIECHDEVNNLAIKLISENRKLDKIKAVIGSLTKKNDNLRSLAGFRREEHKRA